MENVDKKKKKKIYIYIYIYICVCVLIFLWFQVFGRMCLRWLVCLQSLLMDWSLVYPLISFHDWFTNTYMVLVPAAVLLTLSELDLVFHNCVINIYLQQQKCTSVSFNLLCVFLSCMAGYIINTLSIANISDERVSNDFTRIQMVTYSGINVTHCR